METDARARVLVVAINGGAVPQSHGKTLPRDQDITRYVDTPLLRPNR
jgi:hypothetical protein